MLNKLKQKKQEIGNVEAEIAACNDLIAECNATITDLKKMEETQKDAFYARDKSLNDKLAKDGELTAEEWDELNNITNMIDEMISFYENEIKKIESKIEEQNSKIPSLKEKIENLKKEMGELNSTLKPVSAEAVNMQQIRGFAFEIPFLIYYQMCTTKTNAVYVLPYSGKIVDQSSGGGFESRGFEKYKGSQFGVLGALLKFFMKNIRFNTTPVWGTDQQEQFPAIEVDVDLFNDTPEAAANNFVFVNSIMAKNRFIQYHIMQHNPCVYDIKIDGYNRLYMC